LRHVRELRFAGLHVAASLLALLLSIVNAFVHSHDGYTAVVPQWIIWFGNVRAGRRATTRMARP
jgi:hypothetical protein